MRLGEIGRMAGWLANHPLGGDPLWRREATAVSEGELLLFYARADVAGEHEAAVGIIEQLQAEAIRLTVQRGEVQASPAVILHEPPKPRFFVDELVDGLARLTPARRCAALYALEGHEDCEHVAGLTWRDTEQWNRNGGLQLELVRAQTRHIRLPYVFWEFATASIAAPLLRLETSVIEAFGCDWATLQARYDAIQMIDRRADTAHFLHLVREARGRD